MNSELKLLTTRNFNGVEFNCYGADGSNDGDFWATRSQIGQLLEYEYPVEAIGKIHNRNKTRLDKFSRVTQIDLPSGGAQKATVYSFRGLLEICRYSNQPKADAVMDFLYDIADEIRQRGFYATPNAVEKILNDPDSFIRVLQEVKTLRSTNTALQNQIRDDRPKVIFADAVDASKDSMLIGNFAKLLCQNGINVGQNRLFSWFRENGYFIACRGERWNFPKQEYVDRGLFEIKKSVVNNPDGTTRVNHTTKITGKGQIYFANGFLSGKFRL